MTKRQTENREPRTGFRPSARQRGFSLVEVTLALGIMAFAFITVFGMLPVGLDTFRNSMDKTQTTQISQELLAEAQQTPFDKLSNLYGTLRYYDDEGEELSGAGGASVSGPDGYVYTARIEGVKAAVQTSNDVTVGISKERTRIIEIRIAKNRLVSSNTDANPEKPLARFAFAIADVKL